MRNADGTVAFTNQAFIIDLNPAADPHFMGADRTADADSVVNDPAVPDTDPSDGSTYDDELLNAHFVAGDGRVNENYMVTSVHQVFHEEHNYQVQNIMTSVLAENDLDFLNQWLLTPVAAIPSDLSALNWDGEKLFQAARVITESEYNHIAIDQFFGALYGALPEFVSYSSDTHLGISIEFAQSVYRLGHSMLTNELTTIDPTNPNFDPNATDAQNVANGSAEFIGLIDEGALNPTGFAQSGAAAIALGLIHQTGDEIDEFIAPSIQNGLNGQLLDLGAIDIARGRDVGLPTLNELRQQIYDGLLQYTPNTNGGALAPYQNWADFGDHLRHSETLVNLMAAYARGGDNGFGQAIADARASYEQGTATLDDIRAAAQSVLDAYGADYASHGFTAAQHDAAVQFMVGTPTYDSTTGTWTFADANMGFWDVDLWIGGLAERPLFDGPLGTTFSYILLDMGQRMQDGDRFYYLYRTPMGTDLGDEVIANQFGDLVSRATGLEHLNGDVFIAADKYFFLDGSTTLKGQAPQLTDLDNDNNVDDYFNEANYFLDDGVTPATAGHNVIVGGEGNDFVIAGLGDDTVWGDAGNDQIQGSQGNDHLYGGDGNDIITDDENDDFIRGGAGDDRIFAGPGVIDTVFGDEGDDELHGGDGIDELIGGAGDDIIYGDGDTDVLFGEQGNDYLAGGDSVDEMWGAEGNDWLLGGVGDDHLVGGAGNDLLEGGIGPTANDGDRLIGDGQIDNGNLTPAPADTGFDVASYQNANVRIVADLQTSNANGTGALLDTYSGIDGVVGSRFNDSLTGAGADTTTDNGIDNLLVGGAGDDVLTGLGGDDRIVGDAIAVRSDFTVDDAYATISNWRGTGQSRSDFGANGIGYFLGNNGTAGSADRAVFSGRLSDYVITTASAGWIRVVDTRGIDSTSAGDLVKDVEFFQFSDGVRAASSLLNSPASGQPVISDSTPTEGQALTVDTTAIADPDGLGSGGFTYGWQQSADGTTWTNITGATHATFTPQNAAGMNFGAQAGMLLRVQVGFTDAGGHGETVTSAPTGPVGVNWAGNGSANTFNGTAGDDIANGGGGGDTLVGNAGDDALNGGAGNDVAVYGSAASNYTLTEDGASLVIASGPGGTEGTDSVTSVETLRFGGVNYAVRIANNQASTIMGGAGNDVISGRGGADMIDGRAGNDILLAGAGNDRINQSTAVAGRDFIDGDAGSDTYALTGTSAVEAFQILTRAAAISAGITDLFATTEIVVTRNGVVVSELDNIEEITINTRNTTVNDGDGVVNGGLSNGDTITVVGDFTQTSLNYSTITVNGGRGADTVDISGLASDHRIVFHTGGIGDQVIGTVRPQDVIDSGGPLSMSPAMDPLLDLRGGWDHELLGSRFNGLLMQKALPAGIFDTDSATHYTAFADHGIGILHDWLAHDVDSGLRFDNPDIMIA